MNIIDRIKYLSLKCDPWFACFRHGRCWTHSEPELKFRLYLEPLDSEWPLEFRTYNEAQKYAMEILLLPEHHFYYGFRIEEYVNGKWINSLDYKII